MPALGDGVVGVGVSSCFANADVNARLTSPMGFPMLKSFPQ